MTISTEVMKREEAIKLVKEEYNSKELKGEYRVEVFRIHLRAHSAIGLENADYIDVQTINRFVQIYDALNQTNKQKMRDYDLNFICQSVWKVAK